MNYLMRVNLLQPLFALLGTLLLGLVVEWTCWDLNPGPPPCKGGDLPTDLQAPRGGTNFMLVRCFFLFDWLSFEFS